MRHAKKSIVLAIVVAGLLALAVSGCSNDSASTETKGTNVKPSTNLTSPKPDEADSATTAPKKKPVSSSTAPAAQETDQVTAVDQAAINAAEANNPSLGELKVISTKLVGNWAMVVLQPVDKSTDAASFLMQKQGSKWVAVDFGTAIGPESHPDAPPELFQ